MAALQVVDLLEGVRVPYVSPSPCSLMDKVRRFGRCDGGSIPSRGTSLRSV